MSPQSERKRDKSRKALKNNTTGGREREDGNRIRVARNRAKAKAPWPARPKLQRNGAVGFIDGLGFMLTELKMLQVCSCESVEDGRGMMTHPLGDNIRPPFFEVD